MEALRQSVDPSVEADVLGDREVFVEGELLTHVADVLLDALGLRVDVKARNLRTARRWLKQSGQHADGGRLARAIGAQKSQDLACLDGETDVVDGGERAELPGQVVCFNDLHGGRGYSVMSSMKTSSTPARIGWTSAWTNPCRRTKSVSIAASISFRLSV